MARVVPADKRLPDDDSERLNIGHRASQPRAVQSIYALRSLMASKMSERGASLREVQVATLPERGALLREFQVATLSKPGALLREFRSV